MMDPGPMVPDVLYNQAVHRSNDIWNGQVDRVISTKRRDYIKRRRPHQRMMQYLDDAGFRYILDVPFVRLDQHLITALVERWRPETHTFHLPPGEMTITMADVACIMGLPTAGPPVIGPTHNENWSLLCLELLGSVPEKLKGARVKSSWLDHTFDPNNLPADADDIIVRQFARAYILQILGGMLFQDKSGDHISLIYLPLLREFETYSWGTATLAFLYRQMCKATQISVAQMGGCIILLQLWAWEYMPFLAPIVAFPPDADQKPVAARWKPAAFSNFQTPTHDLKSYRNMIDTMTHDQVDWMPYIYQFANTLPADIIQGHELWRARVPFICFHIVEHYYPDRCIRQFGGLQNIPNACITNMHLHSIDLRGEKYKTDWTVEHGVHIDAWNNRLAHIVDRPQPPSPEITVSMEYVAWYRRITRRFIGRIGWLLQSQVDNLESMDQLLLDDPSHPNTPKLRALIKEHKDMVHGEIYRHFIPPAAYDYDREATQQTDFDPSQFTQEDEGPSSRIEEIDASQDLVQPEAEQHRVQRRRRRR